MRKVFHKHRHTQIKVDPGENLVGRNECPTKNKKKRNCLGELKPHAHIGMIKLDGAAWKRISVEALC